MSAYHAFAFVRYEYEQEEVSDGIDFSGFLDTGDTGEKDWSSPALNRTDVPIPTMGPAIPGEVRHKFARKRLSATHIVPFNKSQ